MLLFIYVFTYLSTYSAYNYYLLANYKLIHWEKIFEISKINLYGILKDSKLPLNFFDLDFSNRTLYILKLS